MKKLLAGTAVIFLLAFLYGMYASAQQEPRFLTKEVIVVMVNNFMKDGGTGFVLGGDGKKTKVLTVNRVCDALNLGGFGASEYGQGNVIGMKKTKGGACYVIIRGDLRKKVY